MSEFAPGIPSRKVKEIPSVTKPQMFDLNIQRHEALRAGIHLDLRIVDPKSGKAYSWAVRNYPKNPGDKTLAVLQPTHTAEYSTWSGTIPSGYGAGKVELFSSDRIEVTKADHEHITFNVFKTNGDTERYALINTNGDDWLFYNITPTRTSRPEMNIVKPKYKSIEPENINIENSNEHIAPKYDGALNAFVLRKQKPIEVYSYRKSKRGPAKLIDHSFRTELYKEVTPKELGGTVLLGELFAKDRTTGKVLSSRDTAARLLSNVVRSRELQTTAPLDNVVFDIVRYKGKDVSNLPYKNKLELIRTVTNQIPSLKLPPIATSPVEKAQLLKEIKSGIHPHTQEGVVIYNLNEPVPAKSKLFNDYDVKITGIFGGKGKYKGKAAGGFTYAKGRVGSGFDDATRIDMLEHPEKYIGQFARVYAQEQHPSGALRVPVFKDIRVEKWAKLKKKRLPGDEAPMPVLNGNTLDVMPNEPLQVIDKLGMTKAEKIMKIAAVDWAHLGKEFLLPSLVIGPVVGTAITAATSNSKEDFKQHIGKGIMTGIAADAVTGLGMGLWNQRKQILKAKP